MSCCPWCGYTAVDMTTHDDDVDIRPRYVCTGPVTHIYRAGEGPDSSPDEPLIILAR